MADYRDHYQEIRAAGANLVAVSVDPAEKSETVRRVLRLPFTILCDTSRRVVQEWGIYNAREKGGISKPAVFMIDPGCIVRFASVDTVASRVPASEIAAFLLRTRRDAPVRKFKFPSLGDFFTAICNSIRFGTKSPRSM